jgi:hypothetical protein
MKFELSETEIETFNKWAEEQKKKVIAIQKESIKDPDPFYKMCWELGFPYAGAIGGHFSFRFTDTSIGTVVVAIDNFTKEECNLTDFSCW